MKKPNKLKILWNACFGNKQARFDARYTLVKGFVRQFGYKVYNPYYAWFYDDLFLKIIRKFDPKAEYTDRNYALYHLARSVRDLPGDTAECGVFDGRSSFLILEAMQNKKKQHCAFDSYEGLSEPEEVDQPDLDEAYEWKKGDLSYSLEGVQKNLKAYPNVNYYKGWIPERFDEVKDKKFCFVHVDVDLYQPTLDSYQFFYERMVAGGMIVCDDYGSVTCLGAKKAIDEFMADKPEEVIHLSSAQGVVIKR